jgi:hypothetical protein
MVESNQLSVEVEGRYIVITMPGSSFRASYFKSVIAPGLVQSGYMTDDKVAVISRDDFQAFAWEAANAKARELGWII